MYESEASLRIEELGQIPDSIIREFREFRGAIAARTTLPWGEHCTECVWPSCYTSCDLYSPRQDGRCQRFVEGMVRIDCEGSVNQYLLKISFKRWGKIWTPGNLRLAQLTDADRMEKSDQRIAVAIQQAPLPAGLRRLVTNKRYRWKKRRTTGRHTSQELPNLFVIECFNPNPRTIDLSLTLRASSAHVQIPFQKLIPVAPGFHREEIPMTQISRLLDLRQAFSAEIIPNDVPDGTVLYFGAMDFVRYAAPAKSEPAVNASPVTESGGKAQRPAQKVKCVVWDLDNTMWNGILVEDGADRLELKRGIVDVIRELDQRGILNSIASKNTFDDAMAVLRTHSLEEYFLYPQISWSPKSEAIKNIARRLNIGIDTLLFVDDSAFERAEVREACPEVAVLDAEEYLSVPTLPACQVTVTAESRRRRRMYQEDAVREQEAEGFSGNYLDFLRSSRIEMELDHLSEHNLKRVHELTQRTNQMNFSGRRYERALLEEVARNAYLDTYVISCRDRYGEYGIVGFSIVDSREPRMTDLMFSCRIQSKRVDHAFMTYLFRKYLRGQIDEFRADYRKTPRNAASGRVFSDLGMAETSEQDGVTCLIFRKDQLPEDDGIVRIVEARPSVGISG
jgi:FkbH-like protein